MTPYSVETILVRWGVFSGSHAPCVGNCCGAPAPSVGVGCVQHFATQARRDLLPRKARGSEKPKNKQKNDRFRRLSGGYVFLHRLLLEHFAARQY